MSFSETNSRFRIQTLKSSQTTCSLSFLPQQIWTNCQKFFSEFSQFVKLYECGSIRIHRTVINVYSNLKLCMWKNGLSYALEKVIMAEVSRHIKMSMKRYQCFPWSKLSIIHGNQHSLQDKVEILLKLSMFFVVKT